MAISVHITLYVHTFETSLNIFEPVMKLNLATCGEWQVVAERWESKLQEQLVFSCYKSDKLVEIDQIQHQLYKHYITIFTLGLTLG